MSEREEIMDLIRNEYDPAPSHYRMGDDWDDGAGRIADAILADETVRLKAALSTKWQPIATAPKMKNIILFAVTDRSESGDVRNWKMDTGYWSTGAECWTWSGYQVRKYDISPTHWQQLPEPPEET